MISMAMLHDAQRVLKPVINRTPVIPTKGLVPGCALCALTITGQPAARADAVSPPATEKARGKLLAPNTATGPRAI